VAATKAGLDVDVLAADCAEDPRGLVDDVLSLLMAASFERPQTRRVRHSDPTAGPKRERRE